MEPIKDKAMTNETVMKPYVPESVQERLNLRNAQREGDILNDANIIAKPLNIPGNKIRLKNPAMVPYWANCVVKGGRRIRQLTLAGFKVCTVADVADAGGCEPIDGHYKNDDLMLMMAPRELYYGALKHNANVAQARLTRRGILQNGATKLRESVNEVEAPNFMKQKIQAFIPGEGTDERQVGQDDKEVTLSEQGRGQ